MKNCNPSENQETRCIQPIAGFAALAMAFMLSLAQLAHADQAAEVPQAAGAQAAQATQSEELAPPPVPANLQVPAGNTVFLVGHAVGSQNYICLPSATGFNFTLFTPQATLFNNRNKQLITHYYSPNPFEGGTIRATWQARDTSTVWGQAEYSSSDANFVKPGAIAWLRVKVVGAQEGPSGGDTLTETTYIQRLNTSGGLAPAVGCNSAADVGKQAFVPYTADYYFYTNR
jgi:hypothetical protein